MILGALMLTIGYQTLTMGFAARIFAVQQGIGRASRALEYGFKKLNLERGLIGGAVAVAIGGGLIAWVVGGWALASFGPLNVGHTLRPFLGGITLVTLGVQTILMSLFYSMLGLTIRR
jgi:hypothetical protein